MEYDDDSSSSAASSGDEMLNMDVSFSQNSAAISPVNKSAKGSDSEGDSGGGKKVEPQDTAKLSGNKRMHDEVTAEVEVESEMEKKARLMASKAFNITFHETKVGVPDKICWLDRTQKGKKMSFPVRVVPSEETVGLALREWNGERECPVQYIQYPHQKIKDPGEYYIASRRGLCPYYGEGDNKKQWCPAKFKEYSKQLKKSHRLSSLELKTEELFLHCVIEKSLEEGDQEKKRAEVDEAVPEEIITSDKGEKSPESDSDDDEEEMRCSGRLTRGRTSMQGRKEPLRPGDRIEFYNIQCVAGDPSGKCEATILYINPKGKPILTLDSGSDFLESDHRVKRIKRNHRGKLVDHDGQYREIAKYDLRKEGDPDAFKKVLANRTAWAGEIKHRVKEQAIVKMKKDGFCPEDMLR